MRQPDNLTASYAAEIQAPRSSQRRSVPSRRLDRGFRLAGALPRLVPAAWPRRPSAGSPGRRRLLGQLLRRVSSVTFASSRMKSTTLSSNIGPRSDSARLRVLAEELHHLLLLAADSASASARIARVISSGADGDAVDPADLGQQQPEPHAAFGDGAVLGAAACPRPCPCRPRPAGRPCGRLSSALPDLVEFLARPCPPATAKLAMSASASSNWRFRRRRGELVVFALHLLGDQRRASRPASSKPSFLASSSSIAGTTARCSFLAVMSNVRRLAGQLLDAVLLREGHLDRAGLAWLHALHLLAEARDEAGAADLDLGVLAGAAGERARRRSCPGSRRSALRPSRPRSRLLRRRLRSRLRLAISVSALSIGFRRRLGLQAGQLDGAEIGHGDFRQQLQLDLELQVAAASPSRLTTSTFGCIAGRRPRSASTCGWPR